MLVIIIKTRFLKSNENHKKTPILLAYEPVWAIAANGVPAESQYAEILMGYLWGALRRMPKVI